MDSRFAKAAIAGSRAAIACHVGGALAVIASRGKRTRPLDQRLAFDRRDRRSGKARLLSAGVSADAADADDEQQTPEDLHPFAVSSSYAACSVPSGLPS